MLARNSGRNHIAYGALLPTVVGASVVCLWTMGGGSVWKENARTHPARDPFFLLYVIN